MHALRTKYAEHVYILDTKNASRAKHDSRLRERNARASFCHVLFKLQKPPARHYRPQLKVPRTLVATGEEYKLIQTKLRLARSRVNVRRS